MPGVVEYVSVAVFLAVVGGTWRLARSNARQELLLELVRKELRGLPPRLSRIEHGMQMLEEDVSRLWAAVRAPDGAPDASRRARFRPYEQPPESEEPL